MSLLTSIGSHGADAIKVIMEDQTSYKPDLLKLALVSAKKQVVKENLEQASQMYAEFFENSQTTLFNNDDWLTSLSAYIGSQNPKYHSYAIQCIRHLAENSYDVNKLLEEVAYYSTRESDCKVRILSLVIATIKESYPRFKCSDSVMDAAIAFKNKNFVIVLHEYDLLPDDDSDPQLWIRLMEKL